MDNEKGTQFLNIAMSSSEMLMNKLNDILDFSLLETNTLVLKPVEFNLRNMLVHIEDVLNLQFDHKMIHFSTFVHENVPTVVINDYKRLKQIMINLMYNALKYTEKGFVSVTIKALPFEDDYSCFNKSKDSKLCELLFSVSDSGCGIEKIKKNQFQLFANVNLKRTRIENDMDMFRSSELMGMGLAFCHKMLERMNSKLELSSTKDIGSTFSFKLRTQYKADLIEPNSAREVNSQVVGKRIHKRVSQSSNRNNASPWNMGTGSALLMKNDLIKTKRSSSVFQNTNFSNLKSYSNNLALKPIREDNEHL